MATGRLISEYAQTIYDVAIENYGGVEGVFALMADNPETVTGLDTILLPGTKLQIRTAPVNTEMLDNLKANRVRIATGIGVGQQDEVLLNLNEDILRNLPNTPLYNINNSNG